MRDILWMFIFVLLCAGSYAQSHQPLNDTLSIPPNTLKVIGKVKKIDGLTARITIIKIIGQGQGLINVLDEGEEVIVKLQKKSKLSSGAKVDASLKEKIGIDASQSSYVLTGFISK